MPAREEAAGAGEHPHRQGLVAVELLQRTGEPLRERGVDGISDLGAVERDQQDVLASLGEHGRLGSSVLMRDSLLGEESLSGVGRCRLPGRALRRRTDAARARVRHAGPAGRPRRSRSRGRLREHARLRLDHLRRQHPAAGAERGVQADALAGSGVSCSTASIVAIRLISTAIHSSSPSRHIRSTGPMSVGHSRRTRRSPSPHHCGASARSSCSSRSRPSFSSVTQHVELVLDVGEDLARWRCRAAPPGAACARAGAPGSRPRRAAPRSPLAGSSSSAA